MIPSGSTVRVWGAFTSSGLLKSGIPVTVDLWTVAADGTTTKRVDGANAVASGDKFMYEYVLPVTACVHATFKTTDTTVDFRQVPGLGLSMTAPATEANVNEVKTLASDAKANAWGAVEAAQAATAAGNAAKASADAAGAAIANVDADLAALDNDVAALTVGVADVAAAVAAVDSAVEGVDNRVAAVRIVVDGLPEAVDGVLTASHGTGQWGMSIPGWVAVTEERLGTDGEALGRCEDQFANPLGYVKIVAYLSSDEEMVEPKSTTRSGPDGRYTIYLEPGATYKLLYLMDGQEAALKEVTV